MTLGSYYFTGRAFYLIIFNNKPENKHVFNIKIENFYLVLGLIIFSQFLLIFNFFAGLNKFNLIFFLISIFIVNLRYIKIPKLSILQLIKIGVICVFFISFYDIGLSKDSYLYHLSSQSWIFSEKIVFGLSNLNPYLGYMSISEYSSSLLNAINLNLAHTFNLVFLITFFWIMFEFIFSKISFYKNLAFGFGIFGILDNFGFDGGRNGFIALQEINKFDYSFSIISILFVIFSIYLLVFTKNINKNELLVLTLLLIFAIQMRVFGIILIPILLYIQFQFKTFLSSTNFSFLLLILWLIKNFINTSCFLYPVKFSCLNSNWLFKNQSEYISNIVLDSFRDPENGINTIKNFDWILNVFLPNNKFVLINFLISLIIFRVCFTLLIKNSTFFNIKYFSKFLILPMLLISLWILMFPQYRFSSFFLMFAFFILNFDLISNQKGMNLKLNLVVTVIAMLLVVNLNDYKTFVENPKRDIEIVLPVIEYEKMSYFGVKPISENSKGILCFQRKDCYSGNYNLILTVSQYNYKTIKPLEDKYYEDLLNK